MTYSEEEKKRYEPVLDFNDFAKDITYLIRKKELRSSLWLLTGV